MVLKPSLYVQHVNGTVHKLMKIWTFTDMCTEFKQSNRQFFFVCFLFSLLLPAAFRCAYCYFMNPARKTRPQAPRLPEFNFEKRLRAESRSPGPSPRSGTDTEESAPPSGGTGTLITQMTQLCRSHLTC